MTAVYLDCNATTPVEPAVADIVHRYLVEEFGNAGSRTHEFGARAKSAVNNARIQVAAVVDAQPDEVIFTSGATESNNLAILGLAEYGQRERRNHIISTAIEHKAVLEPLERLSEAGFEVELVHPSRSGRIDPDSVADRVRPETLLVSVMHVNNETGVVQPIDEVGLALADHSAYFHVDAAQGFGKDLLALRNHRIDLISISGHKIYAPKGIGALVTRRRAYERPPLVPLAVGGGQERGLRPGTLPVHLITGLGLAAEIAVTDAVERRRSTETFKSKMLAALEPLRPHVNGDAEFTLPTSCSLSFQGIDAEAAMVALKGVIAVSNGSACTSASYQPSHVLDAMGLSQDELSSTIRLSWSHLTSEPDWASVVGVLSAMR